MKMRTDSERGREMDGDDAVFAHGVLANRWKWKKNASIFDATKTKTTEKHTKRGVSGG